jgi:hypothetical protein
MARLTYRARKHLKSGSFIFPEERAYPIPDEDHGRNALARVSQHGSPEKKAKVRAAVHRKFPGIKVSGEGEKPKHRADRAPRGE